MNISDFNDNELKTIIYGLATLLEYRAIGEREDLKVLNDNDFCKLIDLFRLELRKRRGELESKDKEDLK